MSLPRTSVRRFITVMSALAVPLLASTAAHGDEPLSAATTTSPQFVAARARALTAYETKTALRQQPSARAARAASRRAHRDLSPTIARRLARATFPDALTAPVWAPLALDAGEHFDSYVNDFVARIERDGEAPLLAKTFVPMRAEDTDGVKRRVDLGLEPHGTVFTSANPLVDVAIARDVQEGLRFERSGITVAPVGVAAVEGTVADDRVLAENVANDTDQIIEPVVTGAEISWHLRSVESPEHARLHFTMPDGARLALDDDEELKDHSPDRQLTEAIVTRDGEVLARVAAPAVVDADGVRVPSWYELDGDDLIMRFPHRGQDLKYPLLADPEVTETWSNSDWNDNDTWFPSQTGSVPYSFARNCCGRTGLQIGLFQLGAYAQGTNGQWNWNTYPRTYVARAEFRGLDQINTGNSLYTGISAPGVGWESIGFDYGTFNGYARDRYGARDGSQVTLGTFSETGSARGQAGLVSMSNMTMFLGDRYAPTVQVLDHSYDTSTWTRAADASVHFKAHDDGLGLKSLGVARTDLGNPNDNTVQNGYWLSLVIDGCAGSRRGRCVNDYDTGKYNAEPAYPNGRLRYSLNALPEGINTIRASAHEVAGGPYGTAGFSPTWTAKVDRTAPAITLSGRASDARVDGAGVPGESLVAGGVYAVAARADDARSGVASVEFTVDGAPFPNSTSSFANACTGDGCPQDASAVLYGADLAVGDHTVRVKATDRAGNTREETFTVYSRVDDGAPFRNAMTGDPDPAGHEDDGAPTDSSETVSYPCGGEDEEPCSADDSANPTVLDSLLEPGGTRLLPDVLGTLPVPDDGSDPRAAVNGVSGRNFWAFSDQLVDFRCGGGSQGDLTGKSLQSLAAAGQPMTTTLDRADWQALRVRQVRYILPYYVELGRNPADPDAASTNPNVPNEFKCAWLRWRIWYASAKKNVGAAQILVSFGEPFQNRDGRDAPASDFYEQVVRNFVTLHEDVKRYTAWNEPDISKLTRGSTEATRVEFRQRLRGAHQAAVYWRKLNDVCQGARSRCAVAAWDATDQKWSSQRNYFDLYAQKLGGAPSIWAVHGYSSAFAGKIGRLLPFLRETNKIRRNSPVWITEVGGIVRIAAAGLSQPPREAEAGLRGLLSKLKTDDRLDRIRRFYYHSLTGDNPTVPAPGEVIQREIPTSAGGRLSKFDTGLVSPYDGKKRQIYCLYQQQNNPTAGTACRSESAY